MLWEKVKESLRDTLSETTHCLWIEPLVCSGSDDESILEIACPDRFFTTWVADNYLARIQQAVEKLAGGAVTVRLVTGPPAKPETRQQLRLPSMQEAKSYIRSLHPRYTFDEFMVGESNYLAQSACRAIANGDTSLGSLLYINAGTGLGKSHLTHAVAHNIISHSPGARLHYLTAQQFSAEMVCGIRTNRMDSFKEKYHQHCDILLLDDVHALTGKVKTQEELNELLDVLLKSGKRIILTGSQAPRDLSNIDLGIRSRMSAGLLATINPPDLKTRRLIIRRKAANCNLPLDEELIDFLAQQIKGDIRLVESAIVGLKAKSSLMKAAPDFQMAREIVEELIGRSQELSAESIRDFMAAQFKISVDDLTSRSRKRSIAFPRQVSMFLARKYTEQGLADIGKAFNRDHSTVLHSIKVITGAMARNSSVRGQVALLSKKLTR